MEKPDYVEEKHLKYLDNLRESGQTNMLGAGSYLEKKFKMDKGKARKVLVYWMETFDERHPG